MLFFVFNLFYILAILFFYFLLFFLILSFLSFCIIAFFPQHRPLSDNPVDTSSLVLLIRSGKERGFHMRLSLDSTKQPQKANGNDGVGHFLHVRLLRRSRPTQERLVPVEAGLCRLPPRVSRSSANVWLWRATDMTPAMARSSEHCSLKRELFALRPVD